MTTSWHEIDLRDYGDWPLAHRAAACLLLALLALSLLWLGLTRSTSAEQQALEIVERDLQARLQHARQRVDALPPLPRDAIEPPASPAPDMPALITAIAGTAQAAGLHGGQFRPVPTPAADREGEALPIALRLSGSWAQLHRFARDLSAPTWGAILGLREIHLRTQTATASAPMLELSATVWMHPRPLAAPLTLLEPSANTVPPRNPFIDTATRTRQASAHTVVGSLRNGSAHIELVLTADGELRRTASGTRVP